MLKLSTSADWKTLTPITTGWRSIWANALVPFAPLRSVIDTTLQSLLTRQVF
jgi:hypothetical protein